MVVILILLGRLIHSTGTIHSTSTTRMGELVCGGSPIVCGLIKICSLKSLSNSSNILITQRKDATTGRNSMFCKIFSPFCYDDIQKDLHKLRQCHTNCTVVSNQIFYFIPHYYTIYFPPCQLAIRLVKN